jgi:hypothetical protein
LIFVMIGKSKTKRDELIGRKYFSNERNMEVEKGLT